MKQVAGEDPSGLLAQQPRHVVDRVRDGERSQSPRGSLGAALVVAGFPVLVVRG